MQSLQSAQWRRTGRICSRSIMLSVQLPKSFNLLQFERAVVGLIEAYHWIA